MNRTLAIFSVLTALLFLYITNYDMYLKPFTIAVIYQASVCLPEQPSCILFVLFAILDFTRCYILKWTFEHYMENLLSEDRKLIQVVRDLFTGCDKMFSGLVTGVEEMIMFTKEVPEIESESDDTTRRLIRDLKEDEDVIESDHTLPSEDLNIVSEEDTIIIEDTNIHLDPPVEEILEENESDISLDENIIYPFHDAPIINDPLPEDFHLYDKKIITLESICKNLQDDKKASALWRLLTFYDDEPLTYEVFRNYYNQLQKETRNFDQSFASAENIILQLNIFLMIFQIAVLVTADFIFHNSNYIFLGLFYSVFNFIFLPSLKQVIEAFFFLVITHPFDSGDRVFIKNDNLVVRRITLFCTIFEKWNGEVIYINNGILNQVSIVNVRRAERMRKEHSFFTSNTVGMLSVTRDMEAMGAKVFKEEVKNSYMWKYRIVMEHKVNFQNGFFMWKQHNKFEKAIHSSIKSAGIRYVPLTKRYAVISRQPTEG